MRAGSSVQLDDYSARELLLAVNQMAPAAREMVHMLENVEGKVQSSLANGAAPAI